MAGFSGQPADNLGHRPSDPHVKIPATLQPLIDATRRVPPALLQRLQVGQVLEARVLAQVHTHHLRLQIGRTELVARSQVGIAPGTRLTLEVVRSQPQPELRILRPMTRVEQQQAAMRSAMRRQLPAAEVRHALAELRNRPLDARQADTLRQLNAVLQDAGIRGPAPTPAGLRRAVLQSGLFHEAGLVRGGTPDGADTKARLLGLLARLQAQAGPPPQAPNPGREPPEAARATDARAGGGDTLLSRLVRLVEGAVARIQLHQAAAVPVEDGPRQVWQLELPIRVADQTRDLVLRIERDGTAREAHTAATWAVNLAFAFETIGSVQCRVALAGERISATFWCERAATHATVERRLPDLRTAFAAQGLEVVHLAGVLGDPPQPLVAVPMPDGLFDERA